MGKSRETLMDPKRTHHGESGAARDMSEVEATVQTKRGRDIVSETPERKCKRQAQAVAVAVSQAKGKKQRAVRDQPVMESAATAVRMSSAVMELGAAMAAEMAAIGKAAGSAPAMAAEMRS